jgi:RNA polymerase sigma factor (sigma-70 family)
MNDDLKSSFLAHQTEILRFLRARLQDQDAAQEVAQEIWIKLESRDLGAVEEPKGYLFTIANHAATDRRLSEARRRLRETAWVDVQPHASEFPDAERVMLGRDRLAAVETCLATLPKRTASIFKAFRFRGIPRNAIAAAEGITVSAVEKHLTTAYRRIMEIA